MTVMNFKSSLLGKLNVSLELSKWERPIKYVNDCMIERDYRTLLTFILISDLNTNEWGQNLVFRLFLEIFSVNSIHTKIFS